MKCLEHLVCKDRLRKEFKHLVYEGIKYHGQDYHSSYYTLAKKLLIEHKEEIGQKYALKLIAKGINHLRKKKGQYPAMRLYSYFDELLPELPYMKIQVQPAFQLKKERELEPQELVVKAGYRVCCH
ncbi:hypothetical protein JXB28_06685 [Candidatus Woesearchaeota archaeon]|nr:hypothetical protein [Candidatus Woesearchaeota archaeon]